ncbi:hypothetical protein HMF7854_04530 [Sphingomonas ginkgonis]|uniref:Uncharacterized protein n=1 Tax=Sphingomonas ginkgonis TaxID=2315330 RepID=A0A429V8B5_9SPHN|nr:hypothetical protein HMF7854_04530 [Sphingomonas ginkgonis]
MAQRLLADPPKLPAVQRTMDPVTGRVTANGGQLLASLAEIYDVAGAIRSQLVSLIAEVKLRDQGAASNPKK